jgi:hypothetical protein
MLAFNETTRMTATIMVMIPTVKTTPTENFWAIDIRMVYKIWIGIAMTVEVDGGVSNVTCWERGDLLDRSVRISTAKLYHRLIAFAVLSLGVEHSSARISGDPDGLEMF